MTKHSDQSGYDLAFGWALESLEALASAGSALVIVDVLSFTTGVTVALERGATVHPYRYKDESAITFAADRGAHCAVSRLAQCAAHPFSLSPESLQHLERGESIVLPSPNGSTASLEGDKLYDRVLACSLRNVSAVASYLENWKGRVVVIAAGERWGASSGPLRPALEDFLGAGALLAALSGSRQCSPEGRVASAAYEAVAGDLRGLLEDCASARELIEMGFKKDLAWAFDFNVSTVVPVLDGCYRDVSGSSRLLD